MMRKSQRRLCYFLMCILLMAGIHTTYAKAESFARQVSSNRAAQQYMMKAESTSAVWLYTQEKNITQSMVCVIENANSELHAVIGRMMSRINLVRRDL